MSNAAKQPEPKRGVENAKAHEASLPATQAAAVPAVAQAAQHTDFDQQMAPEDFRLARLMLMANTSDAVGENLAKMGDIFNSQTKTVIGGVDAPIEIIPLDAPYKTWRVMDISGKKADWLRTDPFTPENCNRDRFEEAEEEIDGKMTAVRYDLCLNFFVFLKKDVDAGSPFPVAITFVRTSFKAGQDIASWIWIRNTLKRPPYLNAVKLSVVKRKFESNTYGVFEVKELGPISPSEIEACKQWPREKLNQLRKRVVEDTTSESSGAVIAPSVTLPNVSPEEGPY